MVQAGRQQQCRQAGSGADRHVTWCRQHGADSTVQAGRQQGCRQAAVQAAWCRQHGAGRQAGSRGAGRQAAVRAAVQAGSHLLEAGRQLHSCFSRLPGRRVPGGGEPGRGVRTVQP